MLNSRVRKRNIPYCSVNGRLSERSFPKYKKLKPLISSCLKKLSRLLCQSREDAQRFIALGANDISVSVSGNLKYDIQAPQNPLSNLVEAQEHLKDRPKWLVGSCREDEEILIVEAFQLLKKQKHDALLIIAPRHVEQFDTIANAMQGQLSYVKRSEGIIPNNDTEVWLVDTMGELMYFYALADVCTVAGSFGKTGGHTPLEPALFTKPIIVGLNMSNFKEITENLLAADGIIQVASDAIALSDAVLSVLNDSERGDSLGQNAKRVVEQNQGATTISVEALFDLLDAEAR